jgi:phage baseplate assembly protein W
MPSNSVYSDIGVLFKKHPSTKDVIIKTDVDAVKQSLTILFLTNKYEKRFDPNFGIGIYSLLFENMTPLTKISLLKKIQYQVSFYEPRVVVEDINVGGELDSNELIIDFYFYVISNPNKQEKLTLSFERTR